MLDGIDAEHQIGGGRQQQIDDLGQALALLLARGRKLQTLQGRERAARRPRRAQQRAEELAVGPGEAGDGPGIAPVERLDQRGRARALEAEPGDHRRHQGGKIEIDGQLADAERRNRLGGEQDHLHIGLSRSRADELDAGLAELALGPEVGALHPQHLAGIGETQAAAAGAPASWRRCAPPGASYRRAAPSCAGRPGPSAGS